MKPAGVIIYINVVVDAILMSCSLKLKIKSNDVRMCNDFMVSTEGVVFEGGNAVMHLHLHLK